MNRGVYLGAAVLLCLAAVAGIVALAVADSLLLEVNLIYTGLGLLLFGAIAVSGATATGRFAWVGWLAAAAAIAAFTFLMVETWRVNDFEEESQTLSKLAGSFALFSFALGWAAVMLNREPAADDPVMRGLVGAALAAMLAVAALLTVALVGDTGSATYFRVVAVVAVVGTLATALIPIARGLRRSA